MLLHFATFVVLTIFSKYSNIGFDKAPKQLKAGKRKLLEDMPEMQEERERYQPGGRGIHRNREMDDEDDEPKKRKKFGDEYKAKVCINFY